MESNNQPEDQSLRDALLGVSVPAGLNQRLLSRLRQEAKVDDELPRLEDSSEAGVELSRQDMPNQRWRGRRRQWLGLALALSLVGLAFGVFQWSRPLSTEQLAQFTLGQLDRLLGEDAVWQSDFEKQLDELKVLDGQVRPNVKTLGFQDIAGGPFAKHCRVWKLRSLTTNKAFYVFDFQQARQIPSLDEQLQAIKQTSGGWSSVAMRTGDHLIVVLVEGTLDSYLYQSQSA
ncbi:MAG: hypothetical protein IT422_08930 [Pirellulaceae bacterium]|jgi:hypothetical protein|nr:hypothetical protein [Pirellulaceae bacterium]